MKLFEFLLAIISWCSMIFFLMRLTNRVYINRVLRKGTRKRLAKKQSFKEWFFYTRYTEIMPKLKFVWYYGNFVAAIISIVLGIVFYSQSDFQVMSDIVRSYGIITGLAGMLSYWF